MATTPPDPEPQVSAALAGLLPAPRSLSTTGRRLPYERVVVHAGVGSQDAARLAQRALDAAVILTAVNPVAADPVPADPVAADIETPRLAADAVGTSGPVLQIDLCTGDSFLHPEGYTLVVGPGVEGPRARVHGADADGTWYGVRTLLDLVAAVHDDDGTDVPEVEVRDWPELGWRGTVEGFYGPPWSHEERLDHLDFAGRHKLNHYVYAPKDDRYHRAAWREPYPAVELDRLAELVDAARASRVRFVYAIAPGLSMRFSDDADHEVLHAKAAQLWDIGVRDFALLFDDIRTELSEPADVASFGEGPGAAGAAHGYVCARFVTEFLAPRGHRRPLLMVPTDYAGTEASPYRDQLADTLPADALVWWTGHDVVVGEVTREHVDRAAATYRRRLLLWDNFPVNDFDRARLFLGPLQGRTAALDGTAMAGVSANPMIEASASQLPLATVADYGWNPAAYETGGAAPRALTAVAGDAGPALRPLVEVCSAWPPSVPQSAHLLALTEAALGEGPLAAESARALLDDLAPLADLRMPADGPLATQLRPWGEAGAHMAQAGRSAAALLLADPEDAAACTRELGEALRRAEQHYPNVLRDILSPFARTVLRRRRGAPDRSADRRGRWVLVLTGPVPRPGEEAVADLLHARGVGVVLDQTVTCPDPAATGPVAVVVTRSAAPEEVRAAARLPVPLLAWAHLVALGMAQPSGVELRGEHADVVAPGHPLAGGAQGRVRLFPGPTKMTWGEPGPAATVVARTIEEDRPTIFTYPAGAPLADGTTAPAGRTAVFLAADALAPWLRTPAGTAVVEAALDTMTPR